MKLTLMAKKVRADAAKALQADPIAVVGMACRAPGGVRSPAALWQLLCEGRTAIREVPPDRWPADAWHDPDPAAPAKSITKHGGFLDQIDGFDAAYFDILPREAERMDPQQRLLLEVAIEALDDAGLPREWLCGTRAGVYVASYHNDYAHLQYGDLDSIDARTLTGTLHSVLTNRLSYFLDLRGPSVSIDTACSSSLVAAHLACQSLRCGEIDLAITGGVSLIVSPELMVSMSKVGFMAPDGRCKTFDAGADGFGRGEGCGIAVLKRLADAIADGDRVLAVIRGSAVNQDGYSTLLAAPNGLAQQAMIREALAAAQLGPERIGFVETHGTGTRLGDPIEVEAIAETVGRPATGAGPCRLGSIKANIGHLEAAAGAMGLIKTVLVLQHGQIPPQPSFERLNPLIALDGTRLEVPSRLSPWAADGKPRCAGVSSFGVGGTNAHVLLEEAPRLPPAGEAAADVPRILPLSARSAEALRELAETWQRFLRETESSAADLCFTAAERRSHDRHRLAVVGRSKDELAARLADAEGAVAGTPKLAFVFSGQGPQWFAMGRELLAGEPVFRELITECDALLRPLTKYSLLDELAASETASRLDQTAIAQPAIFALQVGLAALWRSWGIRPDAVVGHSVGEIAALHVAGVLTLGDAIRVVARRGHIMQEATGLGQMAQVGLTAEEAGELVRAFGDRLSVGAYNGPRSVVLSGESAALEAALAAVERQGAQHRTLPVRYAFHSAQMAPFARRLADELAAIAPAAAELPIYSTVTGAAASAETFTGAYFGRNIREPVRFAAAIAAMAADGADTFVEVSPHPVLAAAISACADGARVVGSLRRGKPEREAMLEACAALYTAGCLPAWQRVQAGQGQVVALPAYPWQRRRFWLRERPRTAASRATVGGEHPLLGAQLATAGRARIFDGGAAGAPWLGEHRILGRGLLPATAIMEAFHAAVDKPVEGFTIRGPLELEDGLARWQIVAADTGELELFRPVGDAWQLIASATAGSLATAAAPSTDVDLEACTESVAADDVYARFAALGVELGPTFRRLREVWRGERVATGWIDCPVELGGAGLHVAVDAGLQLCTIAKDGLPRDVLLPIGADRIELSPTGETLLRGIAHIRDDGAADVALYSTSGEPVARIAGMRFAPAPVSADDDLYRIVWRAAPMPAPERTDGVWLIAGDRGGAATALARELADRGGRAVFERPKDGAALRGIVHLASLDGASFGGENDALDADDEQCAGSLLALVQRRDTRRAQSADGSDCPLYVVTRGAWVVTGDEPAGRLKPRAAAAWGLASVIAVERPELRVHRIDLDPATDDSTGLIAALSSASRSAAVRGGELRVPRLERMAPASDRAIRAEVTRTGTLDGVQLVPLRRSAPRPGEVAIEVLAAGVNFRDVLVPLGMYPGEPVPLGVECVGVVRELGASVGELAVGQRVVGYAPGSLATEVNVPAAFLLPLPDALGIEDAAGIPVAFLTALYGLDRLAGLRAGERVLIHAATGGVGMAAVHLARRAGAEIFATAGSEQKRALLRSLGVRHVMDSRSLRFADEVRAATGGAGVDVVLNSLAGDFIEASLGVLAAGGRFLELGKRDVLTPDEAKRRRPDVAYHLYDLGAQLERDRSLLRPMLQEVLDGVAAGELAPLPVTVYPLAQLADGLRLMAQAKHIGKVVARTPAGGPIAARATYWITGGLGALGLATARWLVDRGARALVLSGRQPPSAQASAAIEVLRERGAQVATRQADAGDRAAMAAIRDEIRASMPPLRGVIHAAGALDDAVLDRQEWKRCRQVLRGKAHGAFVLHELTQDDPLDFFVLYSAAGVLLGAGGQGVYPAANAELDALAQARRQRGLPATSVAWGSWAGAGMAATSTGRAHDVWAKRGLKPVTPERGFRALERLLGDDTAYAAMLPINWAQFLATLPPGADPEPFTDLAPVAPPRQASAAGSGDSVVTRLRAAPAETRRSALLDFLRERALHAIGHDPATPVEPRVPLKELGLDSLMAVELRNTLARSIEQPLPATLLFDYPTLTALADHLSRLLALEESATPQASRTPAVRAASRELAQLSDEEAEALLLAELNGPAPSTTNDR
jgi:acyl transferase domain-containing protein